ncbi:UNKNOWN [Stylonychia lemnae]|uniref:Uncharacterized protein n=1 Tax=Stylonychia lemnae TaxID=5949 RepID=A0A077ZR79_STYLE|nr:UNKNOWN [Stylonychia lemnae]|eukprot:CDW71959.1 UNKNOWN [Stylonychia lemnae]
MEILINFYQIDVKSKISNPQSKLDLISIQIQSDLKVLVQSRIELQNIHLNYKNQQIFKQELSQIQQQVQQEYILENNYTIELKRFSEFSMNISIEAHELLKNLKQQLLNKDQNLITVQQRFQQLQIDIDTLQTLYKNCKSLFDEENLESFFEKQRQFKFKQRENIKQDDENDKDIAEQQANKQLNLDDDFRVKQPSKTEVFENFEILHQLKNDSQQQNKNQASINQFISEQQRYPNTSFMNELKQQLRRRQERIENEENLVFKEFDPVQGQFVEISKLDRDIKDKQLQQKLLQIKEEEQQLKLQQEREQRDMMRQNQSRSNPFGSSEGMSDLFAELRQKANQNLGNDEIFE